MTFVGSVKQMADLESYAVQELSLASNAVDLRGKTHNPENADLAKHLSALALKSDILSLPDSSMLRVPLMSNQTAEPLATGPRSLTEELIYSILALRGEWYNLFSHIAQELQNTNIPSNNPSSRTLVNFGIGECVPLLPFNKAGIHLKKMDWGIQSFKRIPRLHHYQYPKDSVAIIGAACRLPGARNLEELWELLASGEDRHQDLSTMPESRFSMKNSSRAGEWGRQRKWYGNFLSEDDVKGFDHGFFGNNQREATYMDPQQRVLLEVCYEAMESSGYTRHHSKGATPYPNGDNVGVFVGHTYVEYLENTCAHPPATYTSTGTIRAFVAGRLSYYFGWTGPAEVIDTACSSSVVSINRAVKAIQGGECRMAVAGGVNIITGANNFLDLAKTGFLSPTGQCKPFDSRADGYCRGEGAGMVVLKPLTQALEDGDRIMGVIAGASHRQGGLSPGITYPDVPTQEYIFRDLLKQAGNMDPNMVTYMEAHGTGTQANDSTEATSVRTIFGTADRPIELTMASIKGNIGHLEVAAGSASLIKVLCMLDKGNIPPQASFKTWNPRIPSLAPDRIVIPRKLCAWDVPFRAALVNGAGAAGSHAALLVCEPPPMPVSNFKKFKQPIILSAATASSLEKYKSALLSYLDKRDASSANSNVIAANCSLPPIEGVAYTLSEKRQRHKHRLILEAEHTQQLVQVLMASGDSNSFHVDPQQLGEKNSNGRQTPVVLVFGGQSQKSVDLSRALYEAYPVFRARLDEYNDMIVNDLGGPAIIPAVFGDSGVEGDAKGVGSADMVVLQTGFVAIQIAAALTWLESGLKVDTLVGHSLGELTALAVSGALSVRDCLRLVCGRAKLMQKLWGDDNGRMTAVFVTRAEVERLLASSASRDPSGKQKLQVACYNGDTSHVVVGNTKAVETLEAEMKAAGIKFMSVNTTHGFHSHLVEPIMSELDQLSSSLDWKEAGIPVETCINTKDTGLFKLPYSVTAHARQPVFFSDAIKRIEESLGPKCLWIEAGFDTPCIAMTKRALPQKQQQHQMVPVSPNKEKIHPADSITHAVCALWRFGHDVTPWHFLHPHKDGQILPPHVYLPPYQFDHVNTNKGGSPLWIEHVDSVTVQVNRANELQKEVDQLKARIHELEDLQQQVATTTGSELQLSIPTKMVTRMPPNGNDTGVICFSINSNSRRFQKIVSGHAVLQKPLCPASLYMECIVMAIDIILSEGELLHKSRLQDCEVKFEDLDIQAPLGTGAVDIELTLRQLSQPGSNMKQWEAIISSIGNKQSTNKKRTQHAQLKVGIVPNKRDQGRTTNASPIARLARKSMDSLLASGDNADNGEVEKLGKERLYRLFSNFVAYKPFFKGIVSASLRGSEAVAEICVPSQDECGLEETTVARICETVALDNFIHIVGFLINSSSMVLEDEVMVCNSIESFSVFDASKGSKGLDFLDRSSYKVYVSYTMTNPNQADCDGYAFSENGELVATFAGCRFVKLKSRRLEKLLDSAQDQAHKAQNAFPEPFTVPQVTLAKSEPPKPLPVADVKSSSKHPANQVASALSTSTSRPSTPVKKPKAKSSNSSSAKLRQILEVYTGMPQDTIPDNVSLAEMGVDSLAATEMAEELQSSFNLTVNFTELIAMTLKDLLRLSPADGSDGASDDESVSGTSSTSGSTDAGTLTPATTTANTSTNSPRVSFEIQSTRSETSSAIAVKATELLVEVTGADPSLIKEDLNLADLGVDSLAMKEITSTLGEFYPGFNGADLTTEITVGEFLSLLTDRVSNPTLAAVIDVGSTAMGNNTQQPAVTQTATSVSIGSFEVMTFVYKRVGPVEIKADVYFPRGIRSLDSINAHPQQQPSGMPIALMIHGGGHMTLSRKAIRPIQAAYLLSHNILPVSIDYRLCPEVNLIDGAVADVRDAYIWVRRELPSLFLQQHINPDIKVKLDTERVVAIGFSTGGLLATTLGWTLAELQSTTPPPKAILCFYSPLDFTTTDYIEMMFKAQSKTGAGASNPMTAMAHSMSREHILNIELLSQPLTNYMVDGFENAELGWVRPGDTRAELLLSLFREPTSFALSLWLNGPRTSPDSHKDSSGPLRVADLVSTSAPAAKVSALCPTDHLLKDAYTIPTYIVHGEKDEVAPFEPAERFYQELCRRGVKAGFMALPRARHLFDLRLRPGTHAWDEQIAPAYQFLFDILQR